MIKYNFRIIHNFDLNHANRNLPPKENTEYAKRYFARIKFLRLQNAKK
jgi:hypothetical protein